MFFSVKGLAQEKENNCDVRQLQTETYDFVLKNLDSIKKYTPKAELITASLELTENGKISKIEYFTSFGKKEQKTVKIWKGLETFVKETFSRCPDSHFYNAKDFVTTAAIPLPLVKENIEKAKKEVESAEGYIAPGARQKEVLPDSKFKVAVKSFVIKSSRGGLPYDITIEPVTKEGVMDSFRSKMVKLSDAYTIAFDVVNLKGFSYLKYTLYQKVDNKSRTITSELWRPIVNNKVNLSVKGIRDSHPGVKHINPGEVFEFDIDISFSK